MGRLLVFDLDGTLADLHGNMFEQDIVQLQQLEQQGNIIVVCSGKPLGYLSGFMRQVGLSAPILIGENGTFVQFGYHYPPAQHYMLPFDRRCIEVLAEIRSDILALLPNVWCQPNQNMFTPYPDTAEQFDVIQHYIDSNPHLMDMIDVYRFSVCFDFVPRGLGKGNGVVWLANHLGVDLANVVAVGDGVNDYTMFDVVGTALGINFPEPDKVTHNFVTINKALQYLLDNN